MKKTPCIMLVEADILVRHPLAEYLRECGYRVVQAANTDEARTLLAQRPQGLAIDIVLADAKTPGTENVFALASWIRSTYPGIEVILAGTVAAETAKAGDLCDESPTLTKPYDHRLVLDRIRQMLAARDRNG